MWPILGEEGQKWRKGGCRIFCLRKNMQALPIILYRALEERIFFIGHGFIIRESGKREMLEKKPLKELLQKEGKHVLILKITRA